MKTRTLGRARSVAILLAGALVLAACGAQITATSDGYTVYVTGTGFPKDRPGVAYLIDSSGHVVDEQAGSSDSSGTFEGTLTAESEGEHTVEVVDSGNQRKVTTTVVVTADDPVVTLPDCGAAISKGDGTAWQCSFSDDFDGVELDVAKWYAADSNVTGFRAGGACHSPENVSVADGSLTIEVSKETSPVTCPNPDGSTYSSPYRSGAISTSDTVEWQGGSWVPTDRFEQAYGRFEIRAQYPTAVDPGIHGAFWMVPQDKPEGAWPAYGEIDVAEFWSADIGYPYGGNPTHLSPFLHFQGSPDRTVNRGDKAWTPSDSTGDNWDDHACTPLHPEQWHTYTLIWEPTGMSFLVDDVECAAVDASYWNPAYAEDGSRLAPPAPFDKPFNMVLTMGTQGDVGDIHPNVQFPQHYNIDYVRVWK